MRSCKYLIILISIFTSGNIFGHQDFWVVKNFSNVKVRIKTGFNYEEIKKVSIFGKLVKKLASNLGYKEQIFLDFSHHYTSDCESAYFISFDKGEIDYSKKIESPLKKESIVIRQISRQFDAKKTLKLVEYAIKNLAKVKSSQKYVKYKKNYRYWKIKTIKFSKIKEILNKNLSKDIKKIMSLKIKRPNEDFDYGISYYWKNNRYTIFKNHYREGYKDLKTVDNIYDFQTVGCCSAIIFDTDSSFYFANFKGKRKISSRNIIKNISNYYKPFNVQYIDGSKLLINLSYQFKQKEKTLLYLNDKDILIQDLDKFINRCIK